MKTTFVLLTAVSILTIGCKFAQTGWGRGESARLPDWLQQFHRAVPFSDSVGWKAQAYRLPEPYEIPARRLIRQTSINKSAPIRVERYLEFDSLLIHAGTYQTPPGGSSFSVPVTFECRHWFVVTGDGQLVIQRLDFYDRQSAHLQLVFSRGDKPSAPYVFAGTHITHAGVLRDYEIKPFSANVYWNAMGRAGRLYGTVMSPFWMHVGDPAGRDEAEARLRARFVARPGESAN